MLDYVRLWLDLDIHWENANPYPAPIQVRLPSEKGVGILTGLP